MAFAHADVLSPISNYVTHTDLPLLVQRFFFQKEVI